MCFHDKSREIYIKARSPLSSLPFRGQVSEHRTVKWPIKRVLSWYFGHVQIHLKTEANLKIIVYQDTKINKESIINHRGTSIVMDGED